MSYFIKVLLVGSAGLLLLLTSQPANAQTAGLSNFWKQASGNWNDPSNWSQGTLPNGANDDFAIIGGTSGPFGVSTGTATINTSIADMPGGITLGVAAADSGTLQISSGGIINVASTSADGNGNVYVGVAGTGTLNIDRGGSLTAVGLNSSGNAASLIRLGATTGSGTALVNVGAANLARTTRVIGSNVNFTSTNLNLTGTLIDQLTSSSHSALKATNTATLGGALSIQFDPGVTAGPGSTWNLIDALNVAGAFTSVSISGAPSLAINQGYSVRTQSGGLGKVVQLAVEEQLVLNVDRATHVVSIANPGTTGIAMDGYTVHSTALNAINPANWTTLGAPWQVANSATDRVSQVNPTASTTLGIGSTTSLGAIFSPPTPVAFGTPTEDLTFQYTQPDGSIRNAAVTYTGSTGINNLVLRVDPATGAAQINNASSFSASIDAYTIASALGSLDTAQWSSLDDQNAAGGDWQEGGPTTISPNRISEVKPAGATAFSSGQFFNIGNPFNESLNKRDLVFQYLLQGESVSRTGVVVYETISATIPGDYDGNGVVNAADYVIWRKSPGSFGGAGGYTTWRSHFGAPPANGSSGGGLGAQAVPEPNSCALIVLAFGLLFATALSRRSIRPQHAVCLAFRN